MVMLAALIRRSCSEVWRPIKVIVNNHSLPEDRPPPHSDPGNFLQLWDVWGNFPFRQKDIIDASPKRVRNGLGRPHRRMLRQGPIVREAFKLTDSFLRVAGAQARQYALKGEQEEARNRRQQGQSADVQLSPEQQAVLKEIYLVSNNGYSTHFTPDSVGFGTGIRVSAVRQMLSAFLGDVPAIRTDKGYRCDRVRMVLPVKFNIPDDWKNDLVKIDMDLP